MLDLVRVVTLLASHLLASHPASLTQPTLPNEKIWAACAFWTASSLHTGVNVSHYFSASRATQPLANMHTHTMEHVHAQGTERQRVTIESTSMSVTPGHSNQPLTASPSHSYRYRYTCVIFKE